MTQDGGIVVNCRITTKNGENIDTIKAIMAQRLSYIDPQIVPSIEYNETDGLYTVQLPGVKDDNIKLLFSHGGIQIKETYKKYECRISQEQNSSFDSLAYTYNYYGLPDNLPIMLTMVEETEIPHVEELLNQDSIKLLLPKDIQLMWSKPMENNPGLSIKRSEPRRSDLYMIKGNNDNLDINKTFKSSKVKKSPYGESYEISIELNSDGAKKFGLMTERNLGKQLAFILDDMVLMAPNVASKIDGGHMIISGGFTEKEMIIINSVLYSPIIKSDIHIEDIKIVDGDANDRG